MSETPRVFLSHTQSDYEDASVLADRLRESGLEPFLSRNSISPGESLQAALKSHLSASDYLVLLLSPAALESEWVRYELEYAVETDWHQRAITVIPVKVKPCRTPDYLQAWTVIDASRDIERGAKRLVNLLKSAPLVQIDKLDPQKFEAFVFDLLKQYGFKEVKHASRFGDLGFDFTAVSTHKDPFGRSVRDDWIIEVKAGRRSSDVGALHSFLGSVSIRGSKGLFVTAGQITSPGRRLLADVGKSGGPAISVLEGTDLKRLALPKKRLVSKYFGRVDT